MRLRIRQELGDLDQRARIAGRDEARRAGRTHIRGGIDRTAVHRLELSAAQSREKMLDGVAIELDERTYDRALRDAARVALRPDAHDTREGFDQRRHAVVVKRRRRQRRGVRDGPAVPILERGAEPGRLLRAIGYT